MDRLFSGAQQAGLAIRRLRGADRPFRVVYGAGTSAVVFTVCSVPQGSVLGPLLFVLYVADLVNVVEKHGLRLYAYADDSRLTLHFRRDELAASMERLERCIEDVDQWMSANRLMLNVYKTEWLLVGSRRTLSSLHITRPVLQLAGNIVAASDHVRLLGVDIVSDLSLDRHVNNASASCFYRLRQMRRIRRSLDKQSSTSACARLDARRLLELSPCSCAKDDDRQTTTCVKCRCPCRQQYQKV